MERRALALVAVAVAAAALAAGAHGATEASRTTAGWPALRTAGPFLLSEIREKVQGRWGLAWQSLYPTHRAVAPRAAFVLCESQTPLQLPLKSIHVAHVHRAAVHVPGLAQPVAGVAVTIEIAVQGYGPRDAIDFAYTFHLVPVEGRWTWLLSAARYKLYRDDACGDIAAA